ncbi:unnamed protein product, partial [Ectocarpus fasciculatus]
MCNHCAFLKRHTYPSRSRHANRSRSPLVQASCSNWCRCVRRQRGGSGRAVGGRATVHLESKEQRQRKGFGGFFIIVRAGGREENGCLVLQGGARFGGGSSLSCRRDHYRGHLVPGELS